MAKFDVNEDMVRKLAELLNETGLTEIEYKVGEHGVRVSRNSTGQLVASAPATNIQTSDTPKINSEISAGSVLHQWSELFIYRRNQALQPL